MIGKSHSYMNCLQIHGLSLQAPGRRQVPMSCHSPSQENPPPKAESSHAEGTSRKVLKTMSLEAWDWRTQQSHEHLRKMQGSLTSINHWPDFGTQSFIVGIRSASLFCQSLLENCFSFLSYSFSSTYCWQINCWYTWILIWDFILKKLGV